MDLTVILGRTRMPIHMLLRMGRGAVIELESTDSDMVEILANDHPIARGQIIVTGNRISVEVTELIRRAEVVREPGVTIGEARCCRPEAAVFDGFDRGFGRPVPKPLSEARAAHERSRFRIATATAKAVAERTIDRKPHERRRPAGKIPNRTLVAPESIC